MSTEPRDVWGPKLWRVLHVLADLSDRRDVSLLWQTVLKATADVLPCDKCRKHLQHYLRTHTFMKVKSLHLVTGIQIRQQIVQELHALHNDVNQRLGKSVFPPDQLTTYEPGTRDQKLLEVKAILEELKTLWQPFLFRSILPGQVLEWRKTLNLLIALLKGGPN